MILKCLSKNTYRSKQEIDFEKSVCKDTKLIEETTMVENAERIEDVVMYDGFEVQNIIYDIIVKNDSVPNDLHIVFTNKLTCAHMMLPTADIMEER